MIYPFVQCSRDRSIRFYCHLLQSISAEKVYRSEKDRPVLYRSETDPGGQNYRRSLDHLEIENVSLLEALRASRWQAGGQRGGHPQARAVEAVEQPSPSRPAPRLRASRCR